MAYIIFITGCSAGGKTTVYEGLRRDKNLAQLLFHDIDESGVPPVGRGPWREFRIEQLLFDAVNDARNGKSTIVCGITFPHEVTESLYFPADIPVYFVALKAPNEKIRQRLLTRAQQNQYSSTFDECFNPNNIENNIFENLRNQDIITKAVFVIKNGLVIDTKDLSKEDMRASIVDFIYKLERE